ncbi:MAG TPA: hypothetical protein VFV38_08415 [Ktedonobacteraceae bacterium]|nr:hypothetical protein [Ktedonobacteraceae bacterium]
MPQDQAPQYDVDKGLETLSQMIPEHGPQRERFEKLASTMHEVLHNIEQHGMTQENKHAWETNLYQLHIIGFQQHPPVTFNDLCRTDRDYSGWTQDRAERSQEPERETFGR